MSCSDRVALWTIGHSNRSVERFVSLFREHKIQTLIDIRSFPTSKVNTLRERRWKDGMLTSMFGT